ncbi:hypothetical protein Q5H92_23930 [Hymenobacter sp. M29]|uniref:Uncharacterized protein n=1 Tax=Hymenobacter mellowenesis TaxID=3063995 RepID=A0ABT9AHS7_9BACT|nr:hypothetical protein [Hymenobacter sp. M29]MDO7849435.1 hypothetical protein [Hymenobacter sp. M29]
MTTALSRTQTRIFGALVIMAAVFLLKGRICQWLLGHGLYTAYVLLGVEYGVDYPVRVSSAVMDGLFLFELINFSLGVVLINSLEQAQGPLPRVVGVLTYFIVAIYVVAVAVSFLPALLPGGIIG